MQALHAASAVAVRLVRDDTRLRRFVQGASLAGSIPAHLEQEHSRNAYAIGARVANDLSLADLSGAAVHRLVGVFFRRRAASPLEEPDKVATDLEIAGGRGVPIGAQQ